MIENSIDERKIIEELFSSQRVGERSPEAPCYYCHHGKSEKVIVRTYLYCLCKKCFDGSKEEREKIENFDKEQLERFEYFEYLKRKYSNEDEEVKKFIKIRERFFEFYMNLPPSKLT